MVQIDTMLPVRGTVAQTGGEWKLPRLSQAEPTVTFLYTLQVH